VEDVRRLAGRPRAFGDAIAVFAHERVMVPGSAILPLLGISRPIVVALTTSV
jgi:hypothetical protein